MKELYEAVEHLLLLQDADPDLGSPLPASFPVALGDLLQLLCNSFYEKWGDLRADEYDDLQDSIYNLLTDLDMQPAIPYEH